MAPKFKPGPLFFSHFYLLTSWEKKEETRTTDDEEGRERPALQRHEGRQGRQEGRQAGKADRQAAAAAAAAATVNLLSPVRF
jgi:hypothetical protein